VEYSSGKGDSVSGVLKFLGALARFKEPFVSISPSGFNFAGCRTRPSLLYGREMGGVVDVSLDLIKYGNALGLE
jgi:hypothetical protein